MLFPQEAVTLADQVSQFQHSICECYDQRKPSLMSESDMRWLCVVTEENGSTAARCDTADLPMRPPCLVAQIVDIAGNRGTLNDRRYSGAYEC